MPALLGAAFLLMAGYAVRLAPVHEPAQEPAAPAEPIAQRIVKTPSPTPADPPVLPARLSLGSLAGRFVLRGTTTGSDATAWLEDLTTRRVRTYREGDRLDDATLVAIERGAVWLARDQERFRLAFAHGALEPPVEAPTGPPTVRYETVAVTPHFAAEDRPDGLQIDTLEPHSPLARVGLKPGDAIVAINGQRLTDPQNTVAILRRAIHAPRVAVRLVRDGTTHDLTLTR